MYGSMQAGPIISTMIRSEGILSPAFLVGQWRRYGATARVSQMKIRNADVPIGLAIGMMRSKLTTDN